MGLISKCILRHFMLCSCFILLYTPALMGQHERLEKEIGKLIRYETTIDFSLVPGILVGVIDGDSTYICSFGQSLSADSTYELGAVTQPVVAWLAMRACDSLGYTLEESVCTYLPDSLCHDQWLSLTTAQILSQRAGLDRFPPSVGRGQEDVRDPYAMYDRASLAYDMRLANPHPGSYTYSHFAYSVLNWLFDPVGGMEAYAQRIWFGPMKLKHTSWNVADHNVATGHGLNGNPFSPWHVNSLNPSLGLKSSMNDLLTLTDFFCDRMAYQMPLWNREQLRENNKAETDGMPQMVTGWYLTTSTKEWICYHEGRTGGHHVSIAFQPLSHKAVIVISNGAMGSEQLCFLVLDMISRT